MTTFPYCPQPSTLLLVTPAVEWMRNNGTLFMDLVDYAEFVFNFYPDDFRNQNLINNYNFTGTTISINSLILNDYCWDGVKGGSYINPSTI